MAEYRDQTFEFDEVTLDGNTFTGCTFKNSVLVYGASGPLNFAANTVDVDVGFHFEKHAQWTLEFLQGIYRSGEGGKKFVEAVFDAIRSGTATNPE